MGTLAGAPSATAAAEKAVIGSRVSLKTTHGEAYEGTLFTFENGMMVVEQYANHLSDSKAAYRLVNASCLAEFSVLAEPPSRPKELPPIPEANKDLAKTREERAVEKAKTEGAKTCTSATAFAQSIFNELSKTMPCDWMVKPDQDPYILVMEAVIISPPYTPDACKAKGGEDRLKERVQKVLGGILQKVEAEYRSS